ncbi:molecular chaperone GrpE [Planifilum fulgidum]|uniref:Protein GrpE n=1 Tax=Planifilum fulgidum TaxID=201973 RepID=A0A1I2KMT0_9BACL|nr:nucleotide exchange factor GrpE [Planifilum fulgidum]SFF68284.1 molecular chaperone GrpE [Planifilum fulgidum]
MNGGKDELASEEAAETSRSMTENEQADRQPNPESADAAAEESPKRGDSCEQLEKEVEKWKQKSEEHYEMFLRARADLENYRRRARKELEDTARYGAAPLAEALLPVLDNLERALDAGRNSGDGEALYQGVEMVYRQLLNVLAEAGVTPIEAVGKPFDPHLHNAVMQTESDEYEPGTVVEELQRGYRFKDRVLRPTMVKVSK